MVDRRTLIGASAGAGLLAVFGTATPSSAVVSDNTTSATGHIKGATAITQVFGDGQKLVAVAVEFDHDIADSSVSTSTFAVTDRTVTKVYTNGRAGLAEHARNGRYVIVELSPDDATAALWVTGQGTGGGTGGGDDSGGGVGPGGPVVGDTTPGGTVVAAKATLAWTGAVTTTRGSQYAPDSTPLTT